MKDLKLNAYKIDEIYLVLSESVQICTDFMC